MNRKPILLTLAFALITILSQAQNAILKGQVTTSDNQPLEFVNVGIKGLSKGSTTDRFGRFEIKNLEAGTYSVFASFVGIEKQEATITISAGETATLNFTVKESSTDLSEVTRGFLARAGLDDLLHNSFEGNSTGKSTMISAFISDVINIRSNLSVMIFG